MVLVALERVECIVRKSLFETFTIRSHESYWYLATVYRKYPANLETAANVAERCTAKFVDAGVAVFSPIAHTHHVSKHTIISSDSPVWVDLNFPFMRPAKGMIVVQMAGWEMSEGISIERKFFRAHQRPIVYVTIDDPVGDFFKVFPNELTRE